MMNSNKILTVSYGTFSCTLEGFDDSFGTMKAIAEYFRDLASEDRYFGAEPPQPDADMLAHIAQKEISRRVQARQQDGRIVLSAQAEEDAAELPTPAVAQETVKEARLASDSAAPMQASVQGSVVSTSFAPRRPNEISAYYDSYRLNAMKALEADAPQQPAAATDNTPKTADREPAEDAAQTDTPATSTSDKAAVDAVLETVKAAPAEQTSTKAEMHEIDIVPGQPDEDIEAFFASSPKLDVAVDDLDAELEAQTAPAPAQDSIAAKLQRIRSVVSRQTAAQEASEQHPEEGADVETVSSPEPVAKESVVSEAIHDIEEALEADDTAEAPQADDAAKADDADQKDADQDDDEISALLGRVDAESNGNASTDADETAQEDAAPAKAAKTETLAEGTSDDESKADAPAMPRGRVIKVKRAYLDRAIAQGDLEEVVTEEAKQEDAAPAEDKSAERAAGSTLSPEDEDDLARELAEVEAGLTGDDAIAETAQDADATARRSLPSLEDDKGADMNRLLAETDNQMDEPEGATRRDAIAHLRAAVAAKKADVALGASAHEEAENNAYRNDLAEVVKPRRPAGGAARTERPAEQRPAPLKLVAAQRIDKDSPKTTAPIRPRRVAAVVAPAETASAAGGFAEFAAEMGASKLPDLLEAAAAYMAFVEGLDQFSRPQLMNTARQVDAEDFSREEGLRSFGQLLRTGKLQKLEGGRFKASDDIGFQPDARAAS